MLWFVVLTFVHIKPRFKQKFMVEVVEMGKPQCHCLVTPELFLTIQPYVLTHPLLLFF